MHVTVAMCTHNPEPRLLRRAVQAVIAQTQELPAADVLLVDNASNPPLAKSHPLDDHRVTLIREERLGLTAAREAAIAAAKGDVLVFVDDDNIIWPRYLLTVADAFKGDAALGLLGGRVVPEYETEPPPWLHEFEAWLAIRRYEPDLHVETTAPPVSEFFPVGAGFAVRRALAEEYVADSKATMAIQGRRGTALSSGEDTDLGLFTVSRNYKLAVTGTLCVTHVIGRSRLEVEYVRRLGAGLAASALALEDKWAARFGGPVFPDLREATALLLVKTAVALGLSVFSPRYRVKLGRLLVLARARLNLSRSAP